MARPLRPPRAAIRDAERFSRFRASLGRSGRAHGAARRCLTALYFLFFFACSARSANPGKMRKA